MQATPHRSDQQQADEADQRQRRQPAVDRKQPSPSRIGFADDLETFDVDRLAGTVAAVLAAGAGTAVETVGRIAVLGEVSA